MNNAKLKLSVAEPKGGNFHLSLCENPQTVRGFSHGISVSLDKMSIGAKEVVWFSWNKGDFPKHLMNFRLFLRRENPD
jgi:hypothetical protein